MRQYPKWGLIFLVIFALGPADMVSPPVEAAGSSARVTLSATVSPASRLTLNNSMVDRSVKIRNGGRTPPCVVATAQVSSGSSPATLSVSASDYPLNSRKINSVAVVTAAAKDAGGNTLPVSVYEAVTGSLAAGECLGSFSETFNWYLVKNWNCDTRERSITVIYTLTSP